MAKRLATPFQLEQMISERMRGATIFTQRDPMYGWTTNLIASPAQVISLNAELRLIVADLREQYDLAE